MASAVRMHRPRAEVVAAGLGRLEEKVTHFDPQLVTCSRPNTVDLGGRPAWIELPPDPDKLAEICVDGQHSEATNPALEDLLSVLDETERLAQTKRKLGDC
jgi:hypothetical protein